MSALGGGGGIIVFFKTEYCVTFILVCTTFHITENRGFLSVAELWQSINYVVFGFLPARETIFSCQC